MISLTKLDPERNMRRYYRVMVQATVLGEWCLVRAYGRIGRSERIMPPVVCADVAVANLGRGKLADGQRAAEWLRSGDPELVRKAMEYCRHDVLLTVGLHSILLRGDPLILPPRAARQELNEIHWWPDRQERIPDASGAVSTK